MVPHGLRKVAPKAAVLPPALGANAKALVLDPEADLLLLLRQDVEGLMGPGLELEPLVLCGKELLDKDAPLRLQRAWRSGRRRYGRCL